MKKMLLATITVVVLSMLSVVGAAENRMNVLHFKQGIGAVNGSQIPDPHDPQQPYQPQPQPPQLPEPQPPQSPEPQPQQPSPHNPS